MAPWIALCGRKEAGKDTVADHLVAAHGYAKIGMADPVKAGLLALDPYVAGLTPSPAGRQHRPVRLSDAVRILGWDQAKHKLPEVRHLLQRFGTECGRLVHGEDCWIRLALERADALHEAGTPVVVSDVRFPNEVDAWRALGAIVIRVERPGREPVDTHPSETSVGDIRPDAVLVNDGTAEDLRTAATVLFLSLTGDRP